MGKRGRREKIHYLDLINNIEKMPIYLDIDTLNMYVEYLYNDNNKLINNANLLNLKEYVNIIDVTVIMNSDEKLARLEFIKLYLEAKIERGLVKRNIIFKYIKEYIDDIYWEILEREVFVSYEFDKMRSKDIEFINALIFAQLNVVFMHRYKAGLIKMIEDVETNNFIGQEDASIDFLQRMLSDLKRAKRRSKRENSFDTTDTVGLIAQLREAYDKFISSSRFINTGYYGMNLIMGGGLENGRVINIMGATGGGKSVVLGNIVKGVSTCNLGRDLGKTNNKKCILWVSNENNLLETFERVFNMFASTDDIREFTFDEMIEKLKSGGFIIDPDDPDSIAIVFKYYGNEELSVGDLRGIVEEVEDNGMEVILLVQDYIERIKPPNRKTDRRIQLADISNQFKDLIEDLDIPGVTASQFNRTGIELIETMSSSNKPNIVRKTALSMVSESFGMLKNMDITLAIVIEFDPLTNKYYLGVKKLKHRGSSPSKIDCYYQPFVGEESRIMLQIDGLEHNPKIIYSLEDRTDTNLNQAVLDNKKRRKNLKDLAVDYKPNEEDLEMEYFFKNVNQLIDEYENDLSSKRIEAYGGDFYNLNNSGRIVLEWKRNIS